MRRYISMLLLVVTCVLSGHAVTDREMEEAKAITAKLYLRYANNGSDYLDKVNAVTMADLEKRLKPKEKENIKSFKAVSVPGDYAGWNKDQLVRYWSETFFASPGLIAKGKVAKSSVRKRLSSMNVSAPAAATTPPPTPAQPAAEKPKPAPTPTPAPAPAPKPTPAAPTPAPAPVAAAELSADSAAARAIAEAEAELLNLDEAVDGEPAASKKQNSYTWVYILILCGLVAIVVGLVVFASRVLKSQHSNEDDDPYDTPVDKPRSRQAPTVGSASLVAPELAEWRDRARQAENERDIMSQQCSDQRKRIAALTARITQLEQELSSGKTSKTTSTQPNPQAAATESKRPAAETKRQPDPAADKRPASSEPRRQQASTESKRQMPEPESIVNPAADSVPQPKPTAVIYLGRVNNKGIFVRADRNLKPDASVYRLETTDGYAGTYRIANNTDVWDRALANPDHVLGGGCVCADISATGGKNRIITESSGTAIFEDGCWKVIRKAKIAYQ